MTARRPPARAVAFRRGSWGPTASGNIAHGLYPRVPLDQRALETLVVYLSKSVSQRSGRTYAGGLTKFEPRKMDRRGT